MDPKSEHIDIKTLVFGTGCSLHNSTNSTLSDETTESSSASNDFTNCEVGAERRAASSSEMNRGKVLDKDMIVPNFASQCKVLDNDEKALIRTIYNKSIEIKKENNETLLTWITKSTTSDENNPSPLLSQEQQQEQPQQPPTTTYEEAIRYIPVSCKLCFFMT